MSKARPWACITTCILTIISALILLIASSVYTNRSYYLRNYWGVLFAFSIWSIIVSCLGLIAAIGLAYVAFRRFPALTTLFSGLLVAAVLLSIICIIVLFINRANVRTKSTRETGFLMADYVSTDLRKNSKSVMDTVQETYQCCGADQALNWATIFSDGKSTPDSCCHIVTPGCGNSSLVSQTNIYIRGCVEPVASHYRQQYSILIGLNFNFILFALVSAVLGLIFERYIREQYQMM
ncbi:unnamed protein product [Adineta ricciae]|uniref:Tetraspanin n=1 Tax=Adineta ricciae TaxID=249248 RepID=A0A814WRD5_ADIRI|nr:unnamed protein product [Adineta ricciae]